MEYKLGDTVEFEELYSERKMEGWIYCIEGSSMYINIQKCDGDSNKIDIHGGANKKYFEKFGYKSRNDFNSWITTHNQIIKHIKLQDYN